MRNTEQSEEFEDFRLANRRLAGANHQRVAAEARKTAISDLRQARNRDK